MEDPLRYLELPPSTRRVSTSSTHASSSTSRNQSLQILASLVPSSPSLQDSPLTTSTMSDAKRGKLAKVILGDLAADDCKWFEPDRLIAIKALKELSRLNGSSKALASESCLVDLVALARREMNRCEPTKNSRNRQTLASSKLSSSSPVDHLQVAIPNISLESSLTSGKEEVEATETEALDVTLRILNNVLFLHEDSRQPFAERDKADGFQMAIDLLESCSWPASVISLAARLVFFSTLFEAMATKWSVEERGLVESMAKQTNNLVTKSTNIIDASSVVDAALMEIQKAFFNIALYYPRLVEKAKKQNIEGRAYVGEKFHPALLPFLLPTIRLLTELPARSPCPIAPPLSNAIHALLNFPLPPYRHIWLQQSPNAQYSSNPRSTTSLPNGKESKEKPSAAKRVANALFSRNSSSSSSSPSPPSSTSSSARTSQSIPPILRALLEHLTAFFERYFSSLNADEGDAESRAALDGGVELQSTGQPALLLLQKIVDEDAEVRGMARGRILPPDLDRSEGLDKRKDFTGQLVRLMASGTFPDLAHAAGELLLALCDGDAQKMTAEIGYGPCAGFLMATNRASALPSSSFATSKTKEGRTIDPITGKVVATPQEIAAQDKASGLADMTEKEKEREADKLFSLFERLDRTGVVKPAGGNPMREAQESGRFEELTEEQEREEASKDEGLEEDVERDMKAYKDRKSKNKQ